MRDRNKMLPKNEFVKKKKCRQKNPKYLLTVNQKSAC